MLLELVSGDTLQVQDRSAAVADWALPALSSDDYTELLMLISDA